MKIDTRRAISPVLATVILIAITLVAGVAIAGFAFGLFGTLGTTANLQVKLATCAGASGGGTILLNMTNTGGAAGTISGVTPTNTFKQTGLPVTIPANTANKQVSITAQTGFATSGQTVTGSLQVTGGSPVPFSVTCS
jgi:flagellin-like protein